MPKIKVFVTLKNKQTKETLNDCYRGFMTSDKFVYQEENRIVTIYKKYNTITMIRREKENSTFLTFEEGKKKEGSYQILGYHPIKLEIETFLLEIQEKNIHICYQTWFEDELMGDFDIQIQYEVIK